MDPDSAAQFIISKVYDPNWIYQNIQNDCIAGWGPCELKQNWVEIDAVLPKCWHWEEVEIGDNEFTQMLMPCGTCTCHWYYYICWDSSEHEFVKITVPVPDPSKKYYDGECPCDVIPNSDCFSVQTECDK
jgi:hypothetical protein